MNKKTLIATAKKAGPAQLSDREIIDALGADNMIVSELIKEYGRRKLFRQSLPDKISRSVDAYNLVTPEFMGLNHERFVIILLNRANKVLGVHRISEGGVSACVVDPKIIFRTALAHTASGIILAHNHPSGNPAPSDADAILTKKIVEGGKLLEISVLDHVIYTEDAFYSFADEGRI